MIKISELSGNIKVFISASAIGITISLASYPFGVYLKEKLDIIKLSDNMKALILFATIIALGSLASYSLATYLKKKLVDKKKATIFGTTVAVTPAAIIFGTVQEWSIRVMILAIIVGAIYADLYVWLIYSARQRMGKEKR